MQVMTPIINISENDFERASKILELAGVNYNIPNQESKKSFDTDNLIYVPSINLRFEKQRSCLNKNWDEAPIELKKQNLRMPTIPEFIEFLKYTKINYQDIYKEITEVRKPWRAEWLDAYFEKRKDGFYILTHNKTKKEKLDEDTSMKDKTPGISLDDWLNNPTSQGLPRKNINSGDLYYWSPVSKKIARFIANSYGAFLDCCWDSSDEDSNLGVFGCAEGATLKIQENKS